RRAHAGAARLARPGPTRRLDPLRRRRTHRDGREARRRPSPPPLRGPPRDDDLGRGRRARPRPRPSLGVASRRRRVGGEQGGVAVGEEWRNRLKGWPHALAFLALWLVAWYFCGVRSG